MTTDERDDEDDAFERRMNKATDGCLFWIPGCVPAVMAVLLLPLLLGAYGAS